MIQAIDKVIDLTCPLNSETPVYPTLDSLFIDQYGWAARDGTTMEKISLTTHTGTHIDAPLHFIPEGKSLESLSIEKFLGNGVVLDTSPKEPGEPITVDDISSHSEKIQENDVVFLYTGWEKYYGRTTEYLFEYPHLHGESAAFLADLNIKAVGIDTLSVGGWVGEVSEHGPSTEIDPKDSHLPLLENEIVVVEDLWNLDKILNGEDVSRAFFCYPPIKIGAAGGAPVRAFALL